MATKKAPKKRVSGEVFSREIDEDPNMGMNPRWRAKHGSKISSMPKVRIIKKK